MNQTKQDKSGKHNPMYGKKHSLQSRQLMSDSHKVKYNLTENHLKRIIAEALADFRKNECVRSDTFDNK